MWDFGFSRHMGPGVDSNSPSMFMFMFMFIGVSARATGKRREGVLLEEFPRGFCIK
jgi:hypothetical protein